MHEDEQLFLDDSSSHLAKEQMEVSKRVNRITPFVRVFGAASGVLGVVVAGIWAYQSLTKIQ
jgi:hypothetical protein